MKRLLLTLVAALALPTAVNATNYVECETIYQIHKRMKKIRHEHNYFLNNVEDPSKYNDRRAYYDSVIKRLETDFYNNKNCPFPLEDYF